MCIIVRSIGLIVLVFTIAIPVSAQKPLARIEFARGDNRIDATIGGRLFTSYVYESDLHKPVMVPLRSPSGIEVSRRYPLTEIKGGSMDHAHHVGLFFAVDQVNGTNFWNYYRNPGGTTPLINHVKVQEMTGGQGTGKLATVAHWIDKDGRFVLEEDRRMVFVAKEDDEYAIDFSIDLTAQKERVVFEDIEEGVLAIRVSDYLRESDASVRLEPGKALPKESVAGTGRYFSSNGDETAKDVWGKRARWVALQGVKGGKAVGLAVLNHPASINYPTYWHVRDYGLFSANPLGQGDFQRQRPRKNQKNEVIPLRLTLEPGETAHFRFLVIVYEGIRTGEQIEERFKDFTE
jgi:hypothetical protein